MVIIYRGLGFVVILFATLAVIAGNAIQVHYQFNHNILVAVSLAIFFILCVAFEEIDPYDSTFFFIGVRMWGVLAVLVPVGFYGWYAYQARLDAAGVKAEFVAAGRPPATPGNVSSPPDSKPAPPPVPESAAGDAPTHATPPAEPPPPTGMQDKFNALFPAAPRWTPDSPHAASQNPLPAAPTAETPVPVAASTADPATTAPAPLRKPTHFDCNRRSLGVDYVICANDQLLEWEAVLEDAYFETRAALDDDRKNQLRADQHRWSNQFGIDCGLPAKGEPSPSVATGAVDCVATAMRARIMYLKGLVPPPDPPTPASADKTQPIAPLPVAETTPAAAPDADDDSAVLNLLCRGSAADNNEEVVELLTIDEKARSVTIDMTYVGVVLQVVDGARAPFVKGTYDVPGHPEAGFAQGLVRRMVGNDTVAQYFRAEDNQFVFGAGSAHMTVDRRSGKFEGLALVPLACEVTESPTKRRF